MQNNLLKNQNIWLTGASSGIGKALLELMLEQHANVIASSRNMQSLLSLQERFPDSLTLIQADVSDIASVKNCTAQIQTKFKYLDKIILNAGVCHYLEMPNFDAEIIRKNFSVNFFGVVNCLEQALPLLLQAKNPHVIGMSSSVAYLPLPSAEGYGASKAAVLYMLRALQAHKFEQHLDISLICPGFVDTPLTARNKFPMPFLWDSKRAAQYILNGILKRKNEICFPLLLVMLFKLIAILPDSMRIAILSKVVSKR